MNKVVGSLVGIVVLILGGAGYFFMGGFGGEDLDGEGENFSRGLAQTYADGEESDIVSGLRVASFNGQVFGDSKVAEFGVGYYVDLISGYDVFFLLEIRDVDGSSFWDVCDGLSGYKCFMGPRGGRGNSQEQVGVFYKEEFNVSDFGVVGEGEDLFEREPVFVEFDSDVKFYVVHFRPEDVVVEFGALEEIVGEEDGVVLIGDFNADCSYYSGGDYFSDWNWVIGDDVDTTTGATDCAYDRIIVSSDVGVLDSGVEAPPQVPSVEGNIDAEVSDHKLVWVEISGE